MANYLVHHGILGQKWGIRRYQNKDGTLTEEGKARLKEMVGDTSKVHSITREQYEDDVNYINKLHRKYSKLDDESSIAAYCLSNWNYGGNDELKYLYNNFGPNSGWDEYMKYEDWDQGRYNSYGIRAYKDDPEIYEKAKEIEKYEWDTYNIGKQFYEKYLAEENDSGLRQYVKTSAVSKEIDNWIGDKLKDRASSYFTSEITESLDGADTKLIDNSLVAAKNIMSIKSSDSNWAKFDAAIKELGMENKMATTLSQSDWDKINAYIRKM